MKQNSNLRCSERGQEKIFPPVDQQQKSELEDGNYK
jgi:hypothetical protein